MLSRKDLHSYQQHAIDFVKEKKRCALFLDMGLGKTTTTLTVASDFLDDHLINHILIIAPLRVANKVWKQEAKKWEHLKHLSISICTGSAADRQAALARRSEITVINRENVPWLVENTKWRWAMVIVDESSSFKSFKSKRFKALKKALKFTKSVVLLSGTPSPNGQMDLWSQMFLIDQGERLGKTITNFRNRFFAPAGYMGYGYDLNPGADTMINDLISDVCLSMQSEDYLDLPDRIDLTEWVTLSDSDMDSYKEFEKEFILALEADDITAVSAGVLANKLLQFANGSVYDENKKQHDIHNAKIDALKEIVEDNPGENFFVAYNYKSDLARIQKAFPKAVTLSRGGKELDEWNAGKVKMLLAHPASAGHGLNAQYGGSAIVWFGLNWSLELYQQFNARLHRQGQTKPVRVMHIAASGTIDERVIAAIEGKAKTQKELLDHIKCKIV